MRPHIDADESMARSPDLGFEILAVGAERMAEGHDDGPLGRSRDAELGKVDSVKTPAADAGESSHDPIDLAASTEAGRRGEQRQERHERAERATHERQAGDIGERCRRQDDEPDLIGEPRGPRVLDRSLADPWLDELEIGDAR